MANGPEIEMDEVGDVVMGLADGVWGLVKGGIAGLLRVGVNSKGAYLRVGYAIISGESTWCIKTLWLHTRPKRRSCSAGLSSIGHLMQGQAWSAGSRE